MLERHGYAFNELDLGKREPATEDENSLLLFVAVSVSRSLKQNVYGSSTWHASSVQSVSIRCLAVSRRWKVLKTTPSLTTKLMRKGASAFMPVILQVQQQPIYGAIAQRFLQMVSFNFWSLPHRQ